MVTRFPNPLPEAQRIAFGGRGRSGIRGGEDRMAPESRGLSQHQEVETGPEGILGTLHADRARGLAC